MYKSFILSLVASMLTWVSNIVNCVLYVIELFAYYCLLCFQLEIPMDSVISITREKTAIIFPNAIGLQTKNEKVSNYDLLHLCISYYFNFS